MLATRSSQSGTAMYFCSRSAVCVSLYPGVSSSSIGVFLFGRPTVLPLFATGVAVLPFPRAFLAGGCSILVGFLGLFFQYRETTSSACALESAHNARRGLQQCENTHTCASGSQVLCSGPYPFQATRSYVSYETEQRWNSLAHK